MSHDEPEIHVYDFSDMPGASEFRAKQERDRLEAMRRYRGHLAARLDVESVPEDPDALAEFVLDALMVWTDVETGRACRCSCHPHLPTGEFHDLGFGCSCTQPTHERRSRRQGFLASMDRYWETGEGRQAAARRVAEEAELAVWISAHPGIVISRHGGCAPEQWSGEVDGHSFYFRERHEQWRIELDLRPSGQFVRVYKGGDLDDEASFESRELQEGDVIAEGTTSVDGYGSTPAERARFIVDMIRTRLRRIGCRVHKRPLADLDRVLGHPVAWCPACGARLEE